MSWCPCWSKQSDVQPIEKPIEKPIQKPVNKHVKRVQFDERKFMRSLDDTMPNRQNVLTDVELIEMPPKLVL